MGYLGFQWIHVIQQRFQSITEGESNKHAQCPTNRSNQSNSIINQILFIQNCSFRRRKSPEKVHNSSRIIIISTDIPFHFSRVLQNFASFRIRCRYEIIETWSYNIPCAYPIFSCFTKRGTTMWFLWFSYMFNVKCNIYLLCGKEIAEHSLGHFWNSALSL